MPHLIANRRRLHGLTKDRADLRAQFRWETFNAVLYKIGGMLFVIGSIFFFPVFERYADIGAWIFFGGSLLYLIVTLHDLLEVSRYWRSHRQHGRQEILEYGAAASYVWGTILFAGGSVFFVSAVGLYRAGAWCFIVGSLLFVVGAGINVLQVIASRSLITLQLMNLTAVAFVVGSVLFTVASVPYLWKFENDSLRFTLYTFLAGQYLIGSVLFFAGGVFNYWRAYEVVRQEIDRDASMPPSLSGGLFRRSRKGVQVKRFAYSLSKRHSGRLGGRFFCRRWREEKEKKDASGFPVASNRLCTVSVQKEGRQDV